MTRIARVTLKSESPISFSKYVSTPKKEKESYNDYEERTWRERCHYDKLTHEIYIPPMMFANALKETAKYLSDELKVEGNARVRYTKNFESGVMVVEKLPLGIKLEDVQSETNLVPSDGKRGGTTRVLKTFPVVYNWSGVVDYIILDDKITPDVFEKVLRECGMIMGIGRFRPRKWGYYGRFSVQKIEWRDYEV